MKPDTRGVTALRDRAPDAFELIFWELACDMNFDPDAAGPDVEEPEPWDLDDAYPCSLSEMLALLQGGDDGEADRSGDDAGGGSERLRGSSGEDSGEASADAAWDYDVGAAVAVQRAGAAGFQDVRPDLPGSVESSPEQCGPGVEAGA